MTKRQILKDTIGVRRAQNPGVAQRSAALRAFMLEQMPLAGAPAQDLARGGDLEPFCHRLSGFYSFGASHENDSLSARGARRYGVEPYLVTDG